MSTIVHILRFKPFYFFRHTNIPLKNLLTSLYWIDYKKRQKKSGHKGRHPQLNVKSSHILYFKTKKAPQVHSISASINPSQVLFPHRSSSHSNLNRLERLWLPLIDTSIFPLLTGGLSCFPIDHLYYTLLLDYFPQKCNFSSTLYPILDIKKGLPQYKVGFKV